jgi:hypothetical protein
MSIVECRIKEFFLFYLLKIAERSDIHNSSLDIRHSSFPEVSRKITPTTIIAALTAIAPYSILSGINSDSAAGALTAKTFTKTIAPAGVK